jgi:hypothetical protein
LFALAADQDCSITYANVEGRWLIPFRQALGQADLASWGELWREIGVFHPSRDPDIISWWALEPSGKFSVRSLYKKHCQGIPRRHYIMLWRICVPLKIRVFLWQLAQKRLPSSDNIRHRRGPSTGRCALCDEWEDTDHIFSTCSLAKFMWSAVRELMSCSWNPSCAADVCIFLGDRLNACSGFAMRPVFGLCGTLETSLP